MNLLAAPIAHAGGDRFANACVFWYAALTPLWWMTGTLLPLGVSMVVVLSLRRLPRAPGILPLALLWCLVSGMQVLATTINGFLAEVPPSWILKTWLSMTTTGWMLIGLCIALGGAGGISRRVIIRAICMQAGWILPFALISFAVAYGLSLDQLEVPSPLALLLPADMPIVQQQLTMKFFQVDSLMGGRAVRLTLFYPWATTLSLAGAVALLVAPGEEERSWRWLGIAGGLVGAIFGHSRSVVACMVLVGGLLCWLHLQPRARFGCLAALAVSANLALLLGFDPTVAVQSLYQTFTEARSGSSAARYLVYEVTWQHVLEAPLLGYGWMSGPTARWLPTMPLGSHSSFYGLLYTGGAITFVALCLAFLATLLAASVQLQERARDAPAAMAMLLLVSIVANGETFQVMVPSLILAFTWLGVALRPAGSRQAQRAAIGDVRQPLNG